MVAPLIAGAARVTAGAAKKSSTRSRAATTKVPPRRLRDRAQKEQRFFSDQGDPRVPQNYEVEEKRSVVGKVLKAREKVRALRASANIAWFVLPFYSIQVLLWILGLGVLSFESMPLIDLVNPGPEIFLACYFLIALIGILSMAVAALIYSVNRVRWFGGVRMFVFMCCLTGYFVFFLNLFPWIIFWMFAVIFAEDNQQTASE